MRSRAVRVAAALLAATAVLLALSNRVSVDPVSGVPMALPDRVGSRTASEWRYCHAEQCQEAFRADSLAGADRCPRCGGPLLDRSLGEQRLLPAGTRIVRRSYTAPGEPEWVVSVVISTAERRSIHKPQVCLVGQGHTIVAEAVRRVPVAGRAPLAVMVLELAAPDGRGGTRASSYAYWFMSADRETPYHARRLLWIAWDSIVHNRRRPWAYVSIASPLGLRTESDGERLDRFVAQIYPLLRAPAP